MQATKRLEKKKEEESPAEEFMHDVKEGMANVGRMAEEMKDDVMEAVEDAVERVLPKVERIVSTMNREYSYLL